MKWTRKEVKERAKDALRRNYWKVVFVSFIFILLGYGSGSRVNLSNYITDEKTKTLFAVESEAVENFVDSVEDNVRGSLDKLNTVNGMFFTVFVVTATVIFTGIFVVVAVLDIFLINPLWVGAQRFMLKSVDDRGEISELGYMFDHSYLNGVKTTFMRDLHVLLWTLLFIIPGIYKKYQYYMVEFILAENPDMPYREVLQRSKDMMEGQKWDTFVMDLTFIPWRMLGGITCGISEIVYVVPYVNLTRAALYRRLAGGRHDDMVYDAMQPVNPERWDGRDGGFRNGL